VWRFDWLVLFGLQIGLLAFLGELRPPVAPVSLGLLGGAHHRGAWCRFSSAWLRGWSEVRVEERADDFSCNRRSGNSGDADTLTNSGSRGEVKVAFR
jgi:hypothetical protein